MWIGSGCSVEKMNFDLSAPLAKASYSLRPKSTFEAITWL
jgi:hypothetical protein